MAPAQTPLPPLPQTKTAASPAAAFVYPITSGQARQHFLRLALLRGIAFAEDFAEDIPGTVVVTHVDVGLGQIELGRHFIGTAELGRAHVCTPVTNAQLVCCLLLEKKKS